MTDKDKIEAISADIADIKATIEKIWKALNGNGSETGLVTRVALNKRAISLLWKFGVIIFTFMAGLFIANTVI